MWIGLADEEGRFWYGISSEVDIDPSTNDFISMVRLLVQPWPEGWPNHLLDLNAAAVEAGVEVPPRAVNHLHPRVHANWNRELFERIRMARER
jgi:hypothetical protein